MPLPWRWRAVRGRPGMQQGQEPDREEGVEGQREELLGQLEQSCSAFLVGAGVRRWREVEGAPLAHGALLPALALTPPPPPTPLRAIPALRWRHSSRPSSTPRASRARRVGSWVGTVAASSTHPSRPWRTPVPPARHMLTPMLPTCHPQAGRASRRSSTFTPWPPGGSAMGASRPVPRPPPPMPPCLHPRPLARVGRDAHSESVRDPRVGRPPPRGHPPAPPRWR